MTDSINIGRWRKAWKLHEKGKLDALKAAPNTLSQFQSESFQIGTFFAVGSCVGLIGGPVMGWIMKKGVTPKSLVVFGMLLSGVLLIIQGSYKEFFESCSAFFYANVGTKIVHAIGPISASTAIYPIIAVELRERRTTFLPLLEAFYNIGLMVWPSFGSILYGLFGYAFPFVFVGICTLVTCAAVIVLLPNPKKNASDRDKPDGFTMDTEILLILSNITICYLIIGFNDITLSIQLEAFHLDHAQIGYCFAIATVCYGGFINVWRIICDKSQGNKILAQAAGYLLSSLGLFFSAPCSLVSIEPTLHVRLVGQALLGIGLAALFTSSMMCGMKYLMDAKKLPDDVATHGHFSSLLFFSLCFGYLVGHAGFAGYLLDEIGYECVVLLLMLVVAIFSLINFFGSILLFGYSSRRDYEIINGSNNI